MRSEYLFRIQIINTGPGHVLGQCESGELLADRLLDDLFQCIRRMAAKFCTISTGVCRMGLRCANDGSASNTLDGERLTYGVTINPINQSINHLQNVVK
jgi:hypothetical protein